MAVCEVCFRHCNLKPGQRGVCGARKCDGGDGGAGQEGGRVVPVNYGIISALALDLIEKKPLARFHPGSMILSAGSYGCNLRCPFCQNYEISWSDESLEVLRQCDESYQAGVFGSTAVKRGTHERISPEELAATAVYNRDRGNIGVAFTYNEPLVGYEYVRDTAKLVREAGMFNVMVTNGTAGLPVLEEVLPYIDAMNIDLKGFTDHFYRDVLDGDRQMVMRFIERAVQECHVELTTLIIPGENDSPEEMRALSAWVAGLRGADGTVIGSRIPLHITRFFPQFHMTDRRATDVGLIYRLADTARENLEYVYTGNC